MSEQDGAVTSELTPIDEVYDANVILRRENNIWQQRAHQAEARLDGAQEDIRHLTDKLTQARASIERSREQMDDDDKIIEKLKADRDAALAALTEISELDLEGDASLEDAIAIALAAFDKAHTQQ